MEVNHFWQDDDPIHSLHKFTYDSDDFTRLSLHVWGAFSQHVVTISILTSVQASVSFADFLVSQLQRDEEVELFGPNLGPDDVVVECQNGSSALCRRFRIQHCAAPHTCWKFVTFIIYFFLWRENSSINNSNV